MNAPPQGAGSPRQLFQQHLMHVQRWIQSGFRDEASGRASVDGLRRWMDGFPDQYQDVTHLALGQGNTALIAGRHSVAADSSALVVDASSFGVLEGDDDFAAAAMGVLIAEQCRLETGVVVAPAASLAYARKLIARMKAVSALRAWLDAQSDLVEAGQADALLERRTAATAYMSARDGLEPLLRNARRTKETVRDWSRVVYGNAPQATGQEAALEQVVRQLLQRHYVQAALGTLRNAPPAEIEAAAAVAADAIIEFGIFPSCTAAEIYGAFARTAEESRLSIIDRLLPVFSGTDRHRQAITAGLLGLRAEAASNTNPTVDMRRSLAAAKAAGDAYAWASFAASTMRVTRPARPKSRLETSFLLALAPALEAVRGTPKHLPLLAQFDAALAQATAAALHRYGSSADIESSAVLSAHLEARRTKLTELATEPGAQERTAVDAARIEASDWVGRIRHAARNQPDTLILLPTVTGPTTTVLAIAEQVEILEISAEAQTLAAQLASAMARYFETAEPELSFETLGKAAYEALPERLRSLVHEKHTLLVAPDFSANASAPFELFYGPDGFLGLTHVIAYMPSLRAIARALEPEVAPPRRKLRAVCGAAPNALPGRPLRFAQAEATAARTSLVAAGWEVPELTEAQLNPDLLFDGLASASLVHLALHGESSGGSHGVLLPRNERVDTTGIASRSGSLPAVVYLSACSVGASEYLGGGVSRGLAHALTEKGAPAIVASQWPVEDAMAHEFAAAFYDSATKNTMGEAMREARTRVANAASPALWSSLILIGNPWHRLDGSGGREPDAAARLLALTSDPRTNTKAALKSAASALKRDPEDRRLSAALTYVKECAIGQARGKVASADEVRQWAALAHDLGSPGAEALCWTRVADLAGHTEGPDAARLALDRAIDAASVASRSGTGNWEHVRTGLLAERQKLDLDFEVPEIEIAGGLKINDRSDPAVNAVLNIQHAVDRLATRREGALGLRLPDESLDDLCWNAVLLGQRNRFSSEFASAGLCRLLAARAARAGWIRAEHEAEVRRIATGALRFLWPAQRMTYLERERAVGQAGTLRVAIESVGSQTAMDSGTARQAILEYGRALQPQPGEPPANRFARTLSRVTSQVPVTGPSTLASAIQSLIDESPAGSPTRAHNWAWTLGYLLELSYELKKGSHAERAAGLSPVIADLELRGEEHLMAFLMDGYTELRKAPLDPLVGWRYDAG